MNKKIFLIILLIIVIATLFWYSAFLQNTFFLIVDLFNELVAYNEILAIALFFIVSMLAALISPFTNIPLVPIAVLVWGAPFTILLLVIGWVAGDIVAYFIGNHLGRPAINYFLSNEKLKDFEKNIKEHTSFVRALLIRITLPAELGYVFGLVKYNFILYLVITTISELPLAILSTYTSQAVLYGNTLQFIYFVIVIAITLFASFHFIKNHKKNNEIQ